MNISTPLDCGIADCGRTAVKAAILGTKRFCMVPAMSNLTAPFPFIRYNLCDIHLKSVLSNFDEVFHDGRSADYRSAAVFT